MRSVRSSPICGEVRVYAELVLSLINNARPRHDGVRNVAERAQRIGADVRGVRGAQAERSGETVVTGPSLLMRSGALCDGVWRSARLSGAGS